MTTEVPAPEDGEDLEDYWRDLLPSRWYQFSIREAMQQGPGYLSFGIAQQRRQEVYAQASQPEADTPGAPVRYLKLFAQPERWLFHGPREALYRLLHSYAPEEKTHEAAGRVFIRDLVGVMRKQSSAYAKMIGKQSPLAVILHDLHGRDIDPKGYFDENFVARTLWTWIDNSKHGVWGQDECDLLGVTPGQLDLDANIVSHNPTVLQTRLLHLILLGGVYGLFDRAVLVVDNIDDLTRVPVLKSFERRARAGQLDTLLEELDRWKVRHAAHLTILLGWSGCAEDAVLLRGLHEPLMRKLDTSKFWVP